MRPTPYVSSLRVYEPIAEFSAQDQLKWSQITLGSQTNWDEQFRALSRLMTNEPLAVMPDGAHVLDFEGKRYICPWSTAARCLEALETFKTVLPPSILNLFISKKIENSIRENSSAVEDKVSHIITATWTIPPRWFALFEVVDRIQGANEDGPFVVLRTSISNAKKRCLSAHQSVTGAFGRGPIEQDIADLLQWLSIFQEDSIVECDYGGLALYLEKSLIANNEPGLDADTSIEDVAKSLAGLTVGDGALAGQGYERLVTRWRRVAAFEQAT